MRGIQGMEEFSSGWREKRRVGRGGGLGREGDPEGVAEHSCYSLTPSF